jgi:hypothetical protein
MRDDARDKERDVKRLPIAAAALLALLFPGADCSWGQSMDDLNLQVHGYATQGFIYSTNNNWNTTNSTDGSAAWMEAVVNVTAQPQPKLRIGVQARYFLLGTYGNAITLDWAEGDYKVNEHFGFRVGKVKTPCGLLNETQDIDPAHLWILLPQSIYPVASRASILTHYGGVVYGSVPLGDSLGKMEYRAYGGQRVLSSDDAYLQPYRDEGLTLPNGITGRMFGGTLMWDTPVEGWMVGSSIDAENPAGSVVAGPYTGTFSAHPFYPYYFYSKYERNRVMFAGEYNRLSANTQIQFPGAPPVAYLTDRRAFYAMASYKISEKLTAGVYYSGSTDRQAAFTSSRYQKDWALSARYDFNPFLYAKFEQHFINGTEIGFSTSDNTGGYKPTSRMTLLKIGVSF